jgi:hypothetical protein
MYKDNGAGELKQYFLDAPAEFVRDVVSEWEKGEPSEEDYEEVMAEVEAGHYDPDAVFGDDHDEL